jgi:hypothetical protein
MEKMMVPKKAEEISRLNVAFEAMERIEKAIENLHTAVMPLKDNGCAYFGTQLENLVGEFKAHLEGLLEAFEEEGEEEVGP